MNTNKWTENMISNKINLFPKKAECSYVSCYCEENVWMLCNKVRIENVEELARCYVVFVSNEGRTVPLWRQRAGHGDDNIVVWDYHVFLIHSTPQQCLVFDLDSQLPFPTHFHKYVTETFRSDLALNPEHHRFFRVIPASQYLTNFASDRRHMLRPDGTWLKPPPTYSPISSQDETHNLDDFIDMNQTKGIGTVYNLILFVQRFFSAPDRPT